MFADLVELVVERLDADAKFFRSIGLIAVVTFDRFENGLHFQVAKTDRAAGDAKLWHNAFACGKAAWQMLRRDRRAIAEDGCVLDDVGKFADVAWPRVRLE